MAASIRDLVASLGNTACLRFLHSSTNSLLSNSAAMTSPPLGCLFEPTSTWQFFVFSGTKRRQLCCYFLLQTVPSPLTLLYCLLFCHTATNHPSLPSPISCALGGLCCRTGPRIIAGPCCCCCCWLSLTPTLGCIPAKIAMKQQLRTYKGLMCNQTSEGKREEEVRAKKKKKRSMLAWNPPDRQKLNVGCE